MQASLYVTRTTLSLIPNTTKKQTWGIQQDGLGDRNACNLINQSTGYSFQESKASPEVYKVLLRLHYH